MVTLAASETDMLAVAYHSGRGLPGEQHLALQLWDLQTRKTQPTQPLPLSPAPSAAADDADERAAGATLQWLGFATNGALVRRRRRRRPASRPAHHETRAQLRTPASGRGGSLNPACWRRRQVSADSAGVVRALLAEWDYHWSPIADLRAAAAGPEEQLSVIGLHLDFELQHLQCVPFR